MDLYFLNRFQRQSYRRSISFYQKILIILSQLAKESLLQQSENFLLLSNPMLSEAFSNSVVEILRMADPDY